MLSKRWGWNDASLEENVIQEDRDQIPLDDISKGEESSESWREFFYRWRWLIGLLAVLLGITIYVILFAPPRMGGKIPIEPYQPGRPFYGLRWLRSFSERYFDQLGPVISIVGGFLSFGVLVIAHIHRWRLAGEFSLILISITLAGIAQWFLNSEEDFLGTVIYGFAIVGFISWAWMTRKRLRQDMDDQPKISKRLEWGIVLGIFCLAAFARFYALAEVPYGIEGDEMKWIYEVVQLMVDGKPHSDGEYHRDALPLSFFMQAPFQQLFHTGIFSARIGVVLYSLLGSIAFYWLIQQIAPIPLALLSSYLLSVSIFDISASRLANVESHVKLWPILALALLAWAIRKRRWEIYALCGLSLVLGLLTYDTVWPMLLVVFVLAVIELVTQPIAISDKIKQIAALILPTLIALPVLLPYLSSRFAYYRLDEKGWQSAGKSTLAENFVGVFRSWFIVLRSDFLYNRQGPLLNAILLPFLVLGIVLAVFTLRKQFSRWMLIWAVIVLLPVPIISSSPLGRVYYPALPAVYALISLGIYFLIRESARLLGSNWVPIGLVLGAAAIIWLPLLNFYIYFNEVSDPRDRLIRSEILELVQQAANNQSYIYLPYFSEINDPLFYEYYSVEFGLRQYLPVDQIDENFEQIHYNKLLTTLLIDAPARRTVEIFLDKDNPFNREEREQIRKALLRCFPGGTLYGGYFYDRYQLDPAAISQPVCVPTEVSLSLREENTLVDNKNPILDWETNVEDVSQLRLLCNRMRSDVFWVEAEDFKAGQGWFIDTAFVSDWMGDGYLADTYGSGSANLQINLPLDEQMYAWVRYYKRKIDNFPAYLTLGDQTHAFTNIPYDGLNMWLWEKVGSFNVERENSSWKISRPYNDYPARFMALFIDAIVFTTDPNYSPLDETNQELLLVEEYDLSDIAGNGEIEVSLAPGDYYCAIEIESEVPLVNAYGQIPVRSNIEEINVPGE